MDYNYATNDKTVVIKYSYSQQRSSKIATNGEAGFP